MQLTPDTAYKRIYRHGFMVAELLRLLLPDVPGGQRLQSALRLEELERMFEQSVDEQRHRRLRDMVWSVPLNGPAYPDWRHLRVFLEFQEPTDRLMPLRLRHYADGHRLEEWAKRPFGASDRIAPVLAIVLHTGAWRWSAPRTAAALALPDAATIWRPDLSSPSSPLLSGDGHLLLDSASLTAEMARVDNAAWLLAALENADVVHAAEWLGALIRRLGAATQKELQDVTVQWALRTLKLNGMDLEVESMAEVAASQANGDWDGHVAARRARWMREYFSDAIAEGVAIGEARGEAKGVALGEARERELLVELARARFDADTAEALRRRLDGVADPERLKQVGVRLVTCDSGAELLARLDT